MSIRSELNQINLNRTDINLGQIDLGEVLTLVISKLSATEAAVVPAADLVTLAVVPTAVFQVNVTAGASTGIKTLTKGLSSALPAAGNAVWEVGTKKIKLAAADVATAVSITYATSTDKASILETNAESL